MVEDRVGDAVGKAVSAARTLAEQAIGSTRAVVELARSGVLRPIRLDRALGMGEGLLRYGVTIAAGYAAGAARHPDRTAIIDELGWLSFAELHRRTDRLARALAATGITTGVRVQLPRNATGKVMHRELRDKT